MKFRPHVALTSIFLLLGVGVTPQVAYASDPCDQRLEGWTYNAGCGESVEFYSRYGGATNAISDWQVDVGSEDARIDLHVQIVAPFGLAGTALMCGDLTPDQSLFKSAGISFGTGEAVSFSSRQTVFGYEIEGSDPSTIRSYFQVDGVSLPFPIVVREFQVAGAEVAFELEGHLVIPKGTEPFEGRCDEVHHSSYTYAGLYSGGPEGEYPFNVLRTSSGPNQGNTSITPSPSSSSTPLSDSNPWSDLFASPSPTAGSQTSAGSNTPAVVRFPEAVLGSTKMYVNGQEVQVESKKSSETELEASTEDGISIAISTPNTPSAGSNNSGRPGALSLIRGLASRIRATGFAPNSLITLWLFSTPTKLSEVMTDANGEINLEFTLPETIEKGEHNLQVSGKHSDGSKRDLVMGVSVVEEEIGVSVVEEEIGVQNSSKAESGPQDQSQLVFWVLGALLLAGLSVAAVVIGRRIKVTKRNPKA